MGACTGCTYESYLDGTLAIPGETIEFVVTDAAVTGYDTDVSGLQDLALGDGVRLDGAPRRRCRPVWALLPTVCRSSN